MSIVGCISLCCGAASLLIQVGEISLGEISRSKHRDELLFFFQELKHTLLDLEAVDRSIIKSLALSPQKKAAILMSPRFPPSKHWDEDDLEALKTYWQNYYDMYENTVTKVFDLISLLVQNKNFCIARNNPVSDFLRV